MSGKQQDPRTRKTKEAILQTFKQMLLEMNLSQITIKELTARVGVNRKTFYHHFDNIDDLIHEFKEQILSTSMDRFRNSIEKKDYTSLIKESFRFWSIEIALNYALSSRDDLSEINTYLYQAIYNSDIFRDFWTDFKYPELAQAYMTGAFKDLLVYWYSNGKQISLDQLAEYGAGLVVNGLQSGLKDVPEKIRPYENPAFRSP